MKKIALYILTTAMAYSWASCVDLDLDPTDRFSDKVVWESQAPVDAYVTGLYAHMRDASQLYTTSLSDCYSDILKSSSWDQYNHQFNKALLEPEFFKTTDAGPLNKWGNYERIKRQNEFLYDAPEKGAHLGDDFVKSRMGEVRFIRAYAYFEMARVFGGVIIRDEVGGLDSSPEKNKARASEAETWKFINDNLKIAGADLPSTWDSKWTGRATKKSAYGLLSRTALYAKDWATVIEAADSVKKYGGALLPTYASVFTTPLESNTEVLFAVQFSDPLLHNYDRYFRPSGDKQVLSAAVPTKELVDSYEMKDGKKFDWGVNGDEPYKDREPRFYASILYNGAQWEGRTIQTYEGGSDGFKPWVASSAVTTTVTGYYMRKYLQENHDYSVDKSSQTDIFIRYSEVLLNKAEALAELNFSANKDKALGALNDVRGRVGLPDIEAAKIATKDDFMACIRQERMVELAFEGFRFWDLRRWRLAENVIHGKSAHGTKITKNMDGTFTYTTVDCDAGLKRYFPSKYYLLSIPNDERLNNTLIGDNNPGW